MGRGILDAPPIGAVVCFFIPFPVGRVPCQGRFHEVAEGTGVQKLVCDREGGILWKFMVWVGQCSALAGLHDMVARYAGGWGHPPLRFIMVR